MRFISTRGGETVSASAAILQGIASDGGLFIPERIPSAELCRLVGLNSYAETAAEIMQLFLEEFEPAELKRMADEAYSSFDTPMVAPVVNLSPKMSVTELWYGPTMAFKDVALQMLPRLIRYSADREKNSKEICILVATSGDTGKAALEGFKDVSSTKILVFYPHNGVSNAQRLQMVTQQGKNVGVCAVEGNFDDAQSALKGVFCDETLSEKLEERGMMLSSANSINFGRLLPQIAYYFTSYISLVKSGAIGLGDEINFCVPTGNFGDILAGHYAKRMGLPIHKLICASNQNRVLADFLKNGKYNVNRDFYKSMSCSIDILISSNFERYLYELCSGDTEAVTEHMKSLLEHGKFALTSEQLTRAQTEFFGCCCTEKETLATIERTFRERDYLMDPHTAVAMYAAEEYQSKTGDDRHMVILSTASPYKFASSVFSAFLKPSDDDFLNADRLNRLTGIPIPEPLRELKGRTERHTEVIPLSEMKNYISNKLCEAELWK